MNEIKEIYRVNYFKDKYNFVGTLRNQYKFNLNDNVFFVINENEIARGRIVGVELPPSDNPEYSYKIQFPKDLLNKHLSFEEIYQGENLGNITLRCDKIFNDIEDAKRSAIKNLQQMFKLQLEEIKRYFEQF